MSYSALDIFGYRPSYLPDMDFTVVSSVPERDLLVSERTEKVHGGNTVRVVLDDPEIINFKP